MATAADSPPNGDRVTLAVIATKLDGIAAAIAEMKSCTGDHEKRLNSLENGAERRQTHIDNIRDDVKALEAKSNTWSILNSIAAIIAAILAGVGFSK